MFDTELLAHIRIDEYTTPMNTPKRGARAKRQLTEEGFEEVARVFRLLGDPSRLRILYLLRQQPRSVGEIAETLECSQPTASRQLARLFDAAILSREQTGTVVTYAIADPTIFALCELVCGGLEEQQKKARRLFV